MNEFDNLKEIWAQQKPHDLPDVATIISKAARELKTMVRKIIIQVATMLLATVAIIWVVVAIDFKMATTYIGAGIMLLVVFGFASLRIYQVVWINGIDLSDVPAKVLAQTEQFYKFQQFVNTKLTVAYFILLNIGFGFYFLEVLQPMKTLWIVVFLTVYFAWMLIAYFILGKRAIRKEHERTQIIIGTIRKIEGEL